nr:uncharacterized protein CI109_000342 [Kwoniella shandongensis]KAA5531500.1 hypothetical protein CI109_000342 [Kwoniella shandongensis]
MSRRPAHGYIDQSAEDDQNTPTQNDAPSHGSVQEPPADHQFDDAEQSGSSVEEESDGEPFEITSEGSVPNSPSGPNHLPIEEEDEDEVENWDVDDEDWELANGDFTKQYNRVRQQQAATSGSAPLPARNVPRQPAKKASKPNPLAGMGVTTNPKVAHERQEKDKSDRATQDQVLDARTRLVLAGLVNRNLIGKIERCANVYFASPGVAVKIYRTSILNFRSRQTYIEGEQRFRGEYTSSKNPRKMIRVWAEKELRNLRRLSQGGVRAPKVHECKENVLVMEFLGKGDEASPRLKDAELNPELITNIYHEMMIAVRRMYQHCHLVHADLSEYNILLHLDHLYIIDVSQSVEHDHPRAFDFLRADLSNVEDFFSRRGSKTLGLRKAWEFVVTENLGFSQEEELGPEGDSKLAAIVDEWVKSPSNQSDDAVFMSSYIPRTLADVYDPERDVDVLKRGDGDDLIYAGVTGLKLSQPADAPPVEQKTVRFEDQEGEEENNDGVIDDGDGSMSESDERKPRGFRHEDKDAKKERKKAVKEENREKRKTKMPKAEKQRLMKKSQSHNK